MAKVRKKPVRVCVACQKEGTKDDFFRVVKNKEEGVLVDFTGKKNGRGAYLCKSLSCIEEAKKSKKLQYRLKERIDETIYEELKNGLLEEQ